MTPASSLLPRLRRNAGAVKNGLRYRAPSRFGFVSGSYRSGTTAVANWIGTQPGAVSLSESRLTIAAHAMLSEVRKFRSLHQTEAIVLLEMRRMLLSYYSKRLGSRCRRMLVDKEPLGPIALPDRNYQAYLESVRAIFPEVRLIMMSRGPVATIWSMTQRDYGHSLSVKSIRRYPLEEHIENWCASADLILKLAHQPNVYICQFERLSAEPGLESRRIGNFLGWSKIVPFQPRPTKSAAFSDEDLVLIYKHTAPQVAALGALFLQQKQASGEGTIPVR